MSDRQSNIELHIEELVLHGINRADRYLIAESVERELTRLLTINGVSLSLIHADDSNRVDAGEHALTSGWKPAMVGDVAANAVFHVITRGAPQHR